MLKRGFKAQSERRAAEYRKQFGLRTDEPLSGFDLSEHLSVNVVKASDVEGVSKDDLMQLTVTDARGWSAFTISNGVKNLIVYNCSQSPPRVNSVVMHELSHIILGHQFSTPSYVEGEVMLHGNYSKQDEAEADWLGATLLLPRPALLKILSDGLDSEQSKKYFNVSAQMLEYRMRMTGVRHQMSYRRKR